MSHLKKTRAGSWLPSSVEQIDAWIKDLKKEVLKQNAPLIKPIKDFKQMVESDAVLNGLATSMFTEAAIMRAKLHLEPLR